MTERWSLNGGLYVDGLYVIKLILMFILQAKMIDGPGRPIRDREGGLNLFQLLPSIIELDMVFGTNYI